MPLTTSAEWDSLSSQGADAPVPLVRLYYGDETSYISLSTQDLSVDGERFLGVLETMPSVRTKVNLDTHGFAIGSLRLDFLNAEYQPGSRLSDIIETLGDVGDEGIYNRKIEMRYWLPGITTWSNSLLVFTGVVRDISHGRESLSLECEDGSEFEDFDVPNEVLTTDTNYFLRGEIQGASLGRYIPKVYGDRQINYINPSRSLWSASQESSMVPLIPLGPDQFGNYRYIVCGNSGDIANIDDIWAFDPRLERYVKVASVEGASPISGNVLAAIPLGDTLDILADNQATSDQQTEADSVSAWTVDGGTIDSVTFGETAVSPQSGTYFLEFTSPTKTYASVEQSVTTIPGATYRLQGYVRARTFTGAYGFLAASTTSGWTGLSSQYDLGIAGDITDQDTWYEEDEWTLQAVEFEAEGTTTYIKILYETAPAAGRTGYADNISLTRSTPACYDYVLPDGAVPRGSLWQNEENAADFDPDTAATITISDGTIDQAFVISFPDYDGYALSEDIDEVAVFAFAKVSGTPTFTINNEAVTDTTATTESQYGTNESTRNGITRGVEAYFSTNGSGWVYEVWKRIRYHPDNFESFQFFASMTGVEYGTWINSRSGHADNNGDGNVIENPAGVVESLLRDQLNLVDADINESSFNTASSNLSTYSVGQYLDAPQNIAEAIRQVCANSRSYVWLNEQDQWTMKAITSTYSSADKTIPYDDFFNLRFTKSDIELVTTDVRVSYLVDPVRSDTSKQTSYFTDEYARTRYNLSQDKGRMDIDSRVIMDSTSAENLARYELDNGRELHTELEGTLSKSNYDITVGDVIAISDMPYSVFGEDITAATYRAPGSADLLDSGQATSDQQTEGNSVSSWTASGGTVSSVTSSEGFTPQSGTYFLKLDPSGLAYVTQSFTTIPGRYYRANAYVRSSATAVSLRVGTTANGFTYGQSFLSAANTWELKTITFKATGTTAYITVQSPVGTNAYADNVYVQDLGINVYPYWWVYSVSRGERITIKARQLHELS